MSSPLVDDARTLWRLRSLVRVLTRRELVARFAGAAGGVLWAWVQPLLTIASYYLVFDIVFAMRMGENAPTQRVGTYLIVGMMAWTAFADAVQRGMSSLVDAGGILQKNPLPPVLFPTRAVLASALVYAPMLLLLALGYWPLHQGSPLDRTRPGPPTAHPARQDGAAPERRHEWVPRARRGPPYPTPG